jgi:hypothetical protein
MSAFKLGRSTFVEGMTLSRGRRASIHEKANLKFYSSCANLPIGISEIVVLFNFQALLVEKY